MDLEFARCCTPSNLPVYMDLEVMGGLWKLKQGLVHFFSAYATPSRLSTSWPKVTKDLDHPREHGQRSGCPLYRLLVKLKHPNDHQVWGDRLLYSLFYSLLICSLFTTISWTIFSFPSSSSLVSSTFNYHGRQSNRGRPSGTLRNSITDI